MKGTRLGERYELLSELGRGGMGVVYLARDPHLDREVAVKVLSTADLDHEAEERFLREAHLVARMDHPSIVPIYDLGRHGEALFFVMPVVRGDTLHVLRKRDAVDPGTALEITAQVAEALDYSHQRGVVHRDIKPENIMVGQEDDRLRVRVMDFGLALGEAGSRLTRTDHLPGTLGYLSPEQILGAELDGRSDLYSLGTILYECLAGKPPFHGSRYTLLYRIVNEEPPPLPGLDPRLAKVIFGCLAKNPENRPPRGHELATLLRRHVADPPGAVAVVEGVADRETSSRPGATPLVGRGREVVELRRRLESAAGGECQLVLIGGEPGMGKTRLLDELEQMARGRRFRVLRGRFSDQEEAFPFQGYGELIQDYFLSREVASSAASELPDFSDLADDLRTLVPALAEIKALAPAARPVAAPAAPELTLAATRRGDPVHLFETLALALARIAGGRPTVFLLEHLHGAEISVEALSYVVRRLGPSPCLFAATYRATEVTRRHPLHRLLKSARDDPRFASLALAPLEVAEIGELVTSQLGGGEVAGELAEQLHEATEGNPFFALELVRSLVDANEVHRGPSGVWTLASTLGLVPETLPETIQQAVESRLERLPDELLEVLQVAAVLGRSFDYQDLEGLVGERAEDAVERLLAAGLLVEDRQPRSDALHFANGVVCDVLHAGMSRRRRRLLHRRHARRLESRHGGRLERVYPQLVHHFAAGDEAGKTVEYAIALAREALAAKATNVAVRALRTALEFVEDEDVVPATEGQLRYLLARALRAAGASEQALKAAARAVRVWRQTGDTQAAAGAALVAAEIAWQGRRVGETRRWVEKGITLARQAEAPETLRRLLVLGATVANLRGEHPKARARWEEAQELAASSAPAAEPLAAGGTLVASLPDEISSVDPRRAMTGEEKEVLANVFEPLVELDAEGHLRPWLCEAWEKAPDSRSFLVRLRRDVLFADGRPLTAAIVKAAFESPGRDHLPPACATIEQAADAGTTGLPGIEVIDEHTLRFRLREPLPIFPILLTDLSVTVFRATDDGSLVGTGPFRLVSHRRDGVRLERNDRYWRGRPPLLDAVELRTYGDSAAAATALREGEIDVGRAFSPQDLDQLLKDPRFRSGLVEATRQSVYFVAVHRQGPATARPEVRRALLDGIRVSDVVWRTLGRFAQPASSLIPPGILGHDPGRRRPRRTRDDVRHLLTAAGLELPVVLRGVAHPLYFDRYRDFTRGLVAEWEALGLSVVLEEVSLEHFIAKAHDGRGIDLWIGRWVADYDDPDNFALGLLHSHEGHLASYLGSPAIDELVVRARQEENASARRALYRKLESILAEERVVLPLFYEVDYRLTSSRIRGLRLLGRPPYVNYSEVAKVDAAAAAPTERDSGVLHVPLPAMFGDLAPRSAQILGNAEVVGNVFETLTRLDEGARIVPCLASEFRLEDGGRRFRFKLRANVRFHDGRKLTVRDVRFTFEELVRGLDREALMAELVPIRGGREFWEGKTRELEGFVIHSAQEFTVALERPLSFFPAMLTSTATAVVPEGSRRFDGDWREGPVGTGPFRVLRFAAGDRLELEACPHYWRRGLPRCERLTFELAIEPGEILAELQAGHLALASGLRPDEIEELLRDRKMAAGYREMPGFSTYFLALDVRRGPLSDPRTRKEVRRLLFQVASRPLLGRLATPAQGFIPPGLLGHEPRARRVVEEAGDAGTGNDALAGIELRAVVFPAYDGPLLPFWEAAVQKLEQAGAVVRVVAASPVETLQRVARGEADLAGARWVASYPDPDALIHLFHSHGYLGTLTGQRELDALFDRGRSETDPALRHANYRQIDLLLSGHVALIPLFHDQVVRVGHPDLSGLRLRFGSPEVAYEELSLAP